MEQAQKSLKTPPLLFFSSLGRNSICVDKGRIKDVLQAAAVPDTDQPPNPQLSRE